MSVPIEIDEKKLLVREDVWLSLASRNDSVALSSVKALAKAAVARGGAFIIYNDDIGVMHNLYRASDLDAFMQQLDTNRQSLGLDPTY